MRAILALMITLNEYLGGSKKFKAEPFNFRGNPDNKAFVKEFMNANNLQTEGQALDFIFEFFKQSFGQANPLTTKVAELEANLEATKAELQAASNTMLTAPYLPISMTGDEPRLEFLKPFIGTDDKDLIDVVVNYHHTAENSIMKLLMDPLHMLEGAEYEALIKWDTEVFMPAMRELTGIADLELTGREKFLLMLDYVQADPASELPQIGLPQAIQDKILNLQFPRAEKVKEILAAKNLIDETNILETVEEVNATGGTEQQAASPENETQQPGGE